MEYCKITKDNVETQHICCAIADKKHQEGVKCKKDWMKNQFEYNYTFYKLDQNGKVFIEYVDSVGAWTPIVAPNYIYIHCFWVSGSFKGKGHAKQLLSYCIADAKARGKSGICVMVGAKKAPYLSDKAYLLKAGFEKADSVDGYELMAMSFDKAAPLPRFSDNAKKGAIDSMGFVLYHSPQCPYILNCLAEIQKVAQEHELPLKIIEVKDQQQAQSMPCVFNNFALFYNGKFVTHQLFNGNSFLKLVDEIVKQ